MVYLLVAVHQNKSVTQDTLNSNSKDWLKTKIIVYHQNQNINRSEKKIVDFISDCCINVL